MRAVVGAIALVLLCAGGARAAEVFVDFTGTLTSQTNPGVDPTFAVGDNFNVTASFDDSSLVQWGNTGYEIVGLYSRLGAPGPSFQINGPAGTGWTALDDFFDGANAVYTNIPGQGPVQVASSPALILQGGKVVGLYGYLDPSVSLTTPAINLGSSIVSTTVIDGDVLGGWGAITPSNSFSISQNNSYLNQATTVGFGGTWNFTGATLRNVSPAPEPPEWALLIVGCALMAGGAFLRKHPAFQRTPV
ncbi:MAG TPA: hypothetical protein VMT68_07890 [Caulobacteraceae bacterium]|nr:hypothetical protein [Caulobacteraceae bacterium]